MAKQLILHTILLILAIGASLVKSYVRTGDAFEQRETVHINVERLNPYKILDRRNRDVTETGGFSVLYEFKKPNQLNAVLHWSPKNDKIMFMLTMENNPFDSSVNSSTLYRSIDYGATFAEVKFATQNQPIISYYYICDADGDQILFVSKDNQKSALYYTIDEGNTSLQKCTDISFSPDFLQFHPTKKDVVFAYDKTTFTVYASTDFCQSWKTVLTDADPRIFWDASENVTLHAEVLDLYSDGYRHMVARLKGDSWEISEFDPELGLIEGESLLVLTNYTFAQKFDRQDHGLYVCYRNSDSPEYKKALFPQDQNPMDFRLVNADEGQVFVAASHAEGHVNLYASDVTGQYFTLQLENLMVSHMMEGSFIADLFEVQGLRGVYIANTRTDVIQSHITHDMGGHWNPLHISSDDTKKASCGKGCSLHVHLYTSAPGRHANPVSNKHAPGLIIVQGMLGTQLNTSQDQPWSVFISKDGGLTWKESLRGDYSVNILDQGGALVAMNRDTPNAISEIQYSFNEGYNWTKKSFSKFPISVTAVLNEPGITTTVVSIYGLDRINGWFVYKLNFSSLFARPCSESDYENLTLSNGVVDHACLLGAKLSFTRQIEGRDCYNGNKFGNIVTQQPCACVGEDFECDYGYVPGSQHGSCKKADWFTEDIILEDCPLGHYYLASGYRKIPSDVCLNDSNHGIPIPCPVYKPDDLRIEFLNGSTVASGSVVFFRVIQLKGTKNGTIYWWNFGDNVGNMTGNLVSHTYNSAGRFKMSVTATNSNGSRNILAYVLVQERIISVIAMQQHAALVGQAVQFRAYGITKSESVDLKDIHYVWSFENEQQGILTWDNKLLMTFDRAGNYSGSVLAINQINVKEKQIEVRVYGDVVTVELQFNAAAEMFPFNSYKPLAQEILQHAVQRTLSDELQVEMWRLDVMVYPNPVNLIVEVSILPTSQSMQYDPLIHLLAKQLIDRVNSHDGLKVNIDDNNFGLDEEIYATTAFMLNEGSPSGSYTALYVCVPLAVVFIIILTVVAWRKRGSCRVQQGLQGRNPYRVLHSRSLRDSSDDPMLDHTLDDDDPLLQDASLISTGERLVLNEEVITDTNSLS